MTEFRVACFPSAPRGLEELEAGPQVDEDSLALTKRWLACIWPEPPGRLGRGKSRSSPCQDVDDEHADR